LRHELQFCWALVSIGIRVIQDELDEAKEIKSYQWIVWIICRFGNEQSFKNLACVVL